MYIPDLSDVKGDARTGLPPEQPSPVLSEFRFESVVLVPFKARVLHDFPHHILHFSHEHGQILITIPAALAHVELLDAPVVHCARDSSV